MSADIRIKVTPIGQTFVLAREVKAVDVPDGTIERVTSGVVGISPDQNVVQVVGETVITKTSY